MEKKPVNVKCIGKKGTHYLIKFPNLKIPVSVNKNLYNKMLLSPQYQFNNLKKDILKTESA
jgi:hypothetical protein